MSPVFEHGGLRLYLLKLLDEQPRHGYDLMQQIEERFQGLYTPSAGTIYPRLSRLQADGLVEQVDGEAGRKTYRLTAAGREELAARKDELADVEAQVVGSARNLAREIREDVKASVRDLRVELRNAVRDVRREERLGTPGTGRTSIQRELDRFGRDLSGRLGKLNDEQLGRLRSVLAVVGDDIVRKVQGPARRAGA